MEILRRVPYGEILKLRFCDVFSETLCTYTLAHGKNVKNSSFLAHMLRIKKGKSKEKTDIPKCFTIKCDENFN